MVIEGSGNDCNCSIHPTRRILVKNDKWYNFLQKPFEVIVTKEFSSYLHTRVSHEEISLFCERNHYEFIAWKENVNKYYIPQKKLTDMERLFKNFELATKGKKDEN